MTRNGAYDSPKAGRPLLAMAIIAVFCLVAGALAVLMSNDTSAESFAYEYDEGTYTLAITGEGAMPNYTDAWDGSGRPQWYNIRNDVATVVIGDGVTSIGNYAFQDFISLQKVEFGEAKITRIGNYSFGACSVLRSFTMPDTVTAIGNYAFTGCSQLRSIEIPASVGTMGTYLFNSCSSLETVTFATGTTIASIENVFRGCTGLSSITIPDSVTNAKSAFYGCSNLASVTFGTGLTAISDQMFSNCKKLETVTLPGTITQIGQGAFYKAGIKFIDLKSITSFGNSAFRDCVSLESISIPAGTTAIPQQMFDGCTALKTVDLPGSIETIGGSAFQGAALETFKAPDKVKELGDYVFKKSKLKTLDLNNVESIGYETFAYCANLTDVDIGKLNTIAREYSFRSCTSLQTMNLTGVDITDASDMFYGCTALKEVTLDDDATTIPAAMFMGCSSLTTVKMGDEVISFGASAFAGCEALETLKFPATLQTIDSSALKGTGLKSVTLGAGVNSIGGGAFEKCTALKTVDMSKAIKLEKILEGTFQDCTALTDVILPEGLKEIYQNAFCRCTSLKAIDIPASVTGLGLSQWGSSNQGSFQGCSALETVTGGEGLSTVYELTFNGCKSLKAIGFDLAESSPFKVMDGVLYQKTGETLKLLYLPGGRTGAFTVPDAVTSFGTYAFTGCSISEIVFTANVPDLAISLAGNTNLVKVTLPEGIVSIGDGRWGLGIFDGCTALRSITLPSTLTTIGANSFRGTGLENVVLPNKVKTMWDSAFANCVNLKSITLGYNLSTIHPGTFQGCAALESIDLRYIVTVEQYAFNGCTSLDEIKFGIYTHTLNNAFIDCTALQYVYLDGVDLAITGSSFSGCTGLGKVVFGEGVKTIGPQAFTNCPNLMSINVVYENPHFALYDGMIFTADFTDIQFIPMTKTHVVIPDTVKYIPAIRDKGALQSIVFGSGIVRYDYENYENRGYPLDRCTALESVTIGKGALYVGGLTFASCPNLKEVILPEGLLEISGSVFEGCTGLKQVVIPSTVTKITSGAFGGCTNLTKIEIAPAEAPRENVLFVKNGVVYNATGTMQCYAPGLRDIVVPDEVKKLSSFDSDPNLRSVVIGTGVTEISTSGSSGYCSFGYSSIETLVLGPRVVKIDGWAVLYCPNLKDIYITGSVPPAFTENVFKGMSSDQVVNIHSVHGEGFITGLEDSPTFVYTTWGMKVTFNAPEVGIVVDVNPLPYVAFDGNATFTISPAKGYRMQVSATVGTLTNVGNVYTLYNITEDTVITVAAEFVGTIDVDVDDILTDGKIDADKLLDLLTGPGYNPDGVNIRMDKGSLYQIPAEAFASSAGKHLSVTIYDGATVIYTWTFDTSGAMGTASNMNLAITSALYGSGDALDQAVKEYIEKNGKAGKAIYLNFAASGTLPYESIIKYFVGKEYAGQTFSLFYYGSAELVNQDQTVTVDGDGYAEMRIAHLSSYVLITDDMAAGKGEGGDDSVLIIGAVVAIVAVIGVLALFLVRRRNTPKQK